MIYVRVDFIDEPDSDIFQFHAVPRIGENVTFLSGDKIYRVIEVLHYLDADGGAEVPISITVENS